MTCMKSISEIPEPLILDATGAIALRGTEVLQSLWGGNGRIVRVFLEGGPHGSVVVKCILPNASNRHPRGWNTDASFQRKLRSYAVERDWYRDYAHQCSVECAVPRFLADEVVRDNRWIVLEDLDKSYPLRRDQLSVIEARVCLSWLAHFHARFFRHDGAGLWETGTYWHLATRKDELAAMEEGTLKEAAAALDKKLNNAQFKTLVHGDAKVANFCFSRDGNRVAAVDFQYVGIGCGIKDVVYFLGSCMSEASCESHSDELLEYYFSVLTANLPNPLANAVQQEWQGLYAVAWADFHRFLAGWMPEHKKINRYTKKMTDAALLILASEGMGR